LLTRYGYFVAAGMAGLATIMRNKFTALGGPDGGDGGRGAHIILKGNRNLWTLLHLRYYKNVLAEDGEKGGANNCHGRDGKDIIIEVPLGTVARDEETGQQEVEIFRSAGSRDFGRRAGSDLAAGR